MIGYSILVGLALAAAVAHIGAMGRRSYFTDWYMWRAIWLIAFGGLLAVMLFVRVDYHAQIARHYEIGASLERARSEPLNPLERAAVQNAVLKTNGNLRYLQSKYKYWAPFIPGAIMDVEAIQ